MSTRADTAEPSTPPTPEHIRKAARIAAAVIVLAHDIAVNACRAADLADSLGVDPPPKNKRVITPR